MAVAALSSSVMLLKLSWPPHTRFISTTVVLDGEVNCTIRSLIYVCATSSPVRSILVIVPDPAIVTVDVTVHRSQMVTGTLGLVYEVTEQMGVFVAVGGVPVTVGVRVKVDVLVNVGVLVGHTPAASVNSNLWVALRDAVLHSN